MYYVVPNCFCYSYLTRLGVRDSDPRMQALKNELSRKQDGNNPDDLQRKMEELKRLYFWLEMHLD